MKPAIGLIALDKRQKEAGFLRKPDIRQSNKENLK